MRSSMNMGRVESSMLCSLRGWKIEGRGKERGRGRWMGGGVVGRGGFKGVVWVSITVVMFVVVLLAKSG